MSDQKPNASKSEKQPPRTHYEAPKVVRRESVRGVTLFSGGVTSATSITGGG